MLAKVDKIRGYTTSQPHFCPLRLKEQYNQEEVVFYELDNIASLSEAIVKAFNNKQQYAENIYKRAINDYSIENMSNQYLKLYCKN